MASRRPAKVKFNPMPIKEEIVLAKYMNGSYIGPWKDWFDRNYRDLVLLEKHYDAMTRDLHKYAIWTPYSQNNYQKIENEILEAVRLAAPYLNREA